MRLFSYISCLKTKKNNYISEKTYKNAHLKHVAALLAKCSRSERLQNSAEITVKSWHITVSHKVYISDSTMQLFIFLQHVLDVFSFNPHYFAFSRKRILKIGQIFAKLSLKFDTFSRHDWDVKLARNDDNQ